MVANKVKSAIGLQNTTKPKPDAKQKQQQAQQKSSSVSRTFGVYFPRASAQVQPRPPDVGELLRLVEELRERESRLKTELLEQKLFKESAAILPLLEQEIVSKDDEIIRSRTKIDCLQLENQRLRDDNEFLHIKLAEQSRNYEEKIKRMQDELCDIKRTQSNTPPKLVDVTNVSIKSSSIIVAPKCLRKCATQNQNQNISSSTYFETNVKSCGDTLLVETSRHTRTNSDEIPETVVVVKSRTPRVPRPPPRPSASLLTSSVSSPCYGSLSDSADRALAEISNIPPPPPPPPPAIRVKASVAPPPPPPPPPPSMSKSKSSQQPPPPPPPPPPNRLKPLATKVRRVPEVVEFYHSLMRRDSICRRDSGGVAADLQAGGAAAKDMIGEIENRSAHLLAIKTDVETQGEFIRFLIKEVEGASFTDIEDVVPFVKWLDDELSYLVDERAVLKHFDWPEQKADALREAAFGYCDLKKLETDASSFRDDPRQPCSHALKKMQSLFEKLEAGVYNLSRMRESAIKRYKVFQIPVNWMLDSGFVSQIKLASVKLAMKYMKRVLAELELSGGGPEEEELIVQGVKFAFRVHQFAGGFDTETMTAFQELRNRAEMCNVQCQNQNQQKFVCRSSATH